MKPENYPQQPQHLWDHFYQFTQIPRPSKQEQLIRDYVIAQAESSGCAWQSDDVGNIVVRVPGTAGRESSAAVIIQNHLDMVTVKTEDKCHDFSNDPLQLEVNDGWLRADRTTLGADNGVGCAAALALMSDQTIEHPPLELLFTVDEETGLGGALNLDATMLSGEFMLNLDTEDWNELYIGCAGGGGREFRRQLETEPAPGAHQAYELRLRGLTGGHSGLQINEQLGNAIKLLGQWLTAGAQDYELRVINFSAGTAHNVIPREGVVRFTSAASQDALEASLEQWRLGILSYLPQTEAQLSLDIEPVELAPVLTARHQQLLLDLIGVLPHGAMSYNLKQPADLVDLSANLAVLRVDQGELFVESNYRFFNEQESVSLQQTLAAIGRRFELQVEVVGGYPGWQPDFDSALLEIGGQVHQELFGIKPAVKAIHAGLECGILKSKKPGVDILSFGPTIRGAHSPTERLKIDTVAPFWQLLTTLLQRL